MSAPDLMSAADVAMGATAAAAAASDLGVSLGLSDPMLEGFKKEGVSLPALAAQASVTKRKKVTHSLFFEDDKGLKKILRTFPTIKFKGKGREHEDVTLLLQHYKKWFQDLIPHGDHFEDLVLKSRSVLEEKEKEDDGTVSDPRERLHQFRYQYKNTPAAGSGGAQLDDEAKARIAENRRLALERKAKKNGTAGVDAGASAAPAPQEIDMDELWQQQMEAEAAAAAGTSLGRESAPQGPPGGGMDEEEDPFGFGGGFDSMDSGAAQAPPPSFDDEEDVFGFGGGFDDEDAPAPPKAVAAPVVQPVAPKPVDPEVARKIAEKRAQALARKAAAAEAAAAAAASIPVEEEVVPAAGAAPEAAAVAGSAPEENMPPSAFDEEDALFDNFDCGFDDQ